MRLVPRPASMRRTRRPHGSRPASRRTSRARRNLPDTRVEIAAQRDTAARPWTCHAADPCMGTALWAQDARRRRQSGRARRFACRIGSTACHPGSGCTKWSHAPRLRIKVETSSARRAKALCRRPSKPRRASYSATASRIARNASALLIGSEKYT